MRSRQGVVVVPPKTMKNKILAGAASVVVAGSALFFIPALESAVSTLLTPQERGVSVMFGGDVMLDRNVAKRAEEFGTKALFTEVAPLFVNADIAVVNLEGTITEEASIARKDSSILRFTFTPSFAKEALAPLELEAVSLGNNHTFDFYRAGYVRTQEYLSQWGIRYFGHPYNQAGNLSTAIVSPEGNICLVAYHELYEADPETTLAEIARLQPSCFRLIVMPHWGEEYEPTPRERVRVLARAFLDAGADMVVGSHPHVVQTFELYKDKPIFYSLGNFMFDQDFSWETTHGLLLQVVFKKTTTEIALVPSSVVYSRASLAQGEERSRVLVSLLSPGLSDALQRGIVEGFIALPRPPAKEVLP